VATLIAEAVALRDAQDIRPPWTREDSGVTRGWHFLHLELFAAVVGVKPVQHLLASSRTLQTLPAATS